MIVEFEFFCLHDKDIYFWCSLEPPHSIQNLDMSKMFTGTENKTTQAKHLVTKKKKVDTQKKAI